jgi:hypothetical protein
LALPHVPFGAVRPVVVQILPQLQEPQLHCPMLRLKVPTPQSEQLVLLLPLANVPMPHAFRVLIPGFGQA